MENLKKLIFQVFHFWGSFLFWGLGEVSLLEVIYFTALEKDFFCPQTR